MNLGMILSIFFAILLGMMAGLTLLVTNLQGILEIVLVYLFFFWEKSSMRTLIRKNLGAHKQRNYLTSIIYALTLGCIIFLLVTANLEIQSIAAMEEMSNADISLISDGNASIDSTITDEILKEYESSISDFGYTTAELVTYQGGAKVKWSDRANLFPHTVEMYGVSPSKLLDKSYELDFY